MDNTSSSALLVLTSWNTASDDLTSQPTRTLVKDFYENTLESDQVSKLHCTVLDVDVSEYQKKDADSVGVTLIPATRSKWADPDDDPPVVNWLFNHDNYYPQLKDLQNVKHIVSFSPKTKNAAAAIHDMLFRQAQLHQVSPPEPNGVLFTFDVWSKHACGLAGYHRAIIQNFCARKARAGEFLKAYTTVVDVEVSEEQKCDAKTCGVILIPAEKKKWYNPKKDGPKLEWLIEHKSHYPDLKELENIKYVVGFCPKTGRAAADIREQIFPKAKLVLINHVCPETNCLFDKDTEESDSSALKEYMLQMASVADVIFSVGPHIYEHFENAYRATVDGRKLSDIPHSEILPLIGKVFFDNEAVVKTAINARTILTYGQLDTTEALEQCKSLVTHVGIAANNYEELQNKPTVWELHGASEHIDKSAQKCFINSSHVTSKFYPYYSTGQLLRSLQQSHLCVPPSCYTDYSFEGLEAMAAGLPIAVQNDCHIASMIEKHFTGREEYCVAKHKDLAAKITDRLVHNPKAFDNAELLKKELAESKAIIESFVNFASLITEEKQQQGKQDLDLKDNLGFTVDLNLNKELYDQQLRTMDEQKTSQDNEQSRSELDNTWRYCKNEFDKKVGDVITSKSGPQTVQQRCEKNCGQVTTAGLTTGSLRITLDIPTQYNLYKLKHTCRSGSFPESFEPLLITDKMREEADKVGLQLKLQATYNQARFDELRLFFMNRDGGGLVPVEIHGDIVEVEDAEEIHIDGEDTDQKSSTIVTGVADRTPTEHRQSLEDIQTKLEMERATLESQLKEAKEETATLEERCKELRQKLESSQNSLVSQRIGTNVKQKTLQSELEEKKKLINKLEDKVGELEHELEQSDLKKSGEKEAEIRTKIAEESAKQKQKELDQEKERNVQLREEVTKADIRAKTAEESAKQKRKHLDQETEILVQLCEEVTTMPQVDTPFYMKDDDQTILRKLMPEFVNDLPVRQVLDRMSNVFSEEDEARITNISQHIHNQRRQLVGILMTKGAGAFDHFVTVLEDVCPHLADRIKKEKNKQTSSTNSSHNDFNV